MLLVAAKDADEKLAAERLSTVEPVTEKRNATIALIFLFIRPTF